MNTLATFWWQMPENSDHSLKQLNFNLIVVVLISWWWWLPGSVSGQQTSQHFPLLNWDWDHTVTSVLHKVSLAVAISPLYHSTFQSWWHGGCFSPSFPYPAQCGLLPPQGGLPNGGPRGPCQRNWWRQFEYPAPRPIPNPKVIGQADPGQN